MYVRTHYIAMYQRYKFIELTSVLLEKENELSRLNTELRGLEQYKVSYFVLLAITGQHEMVQKICITNY